MKRATREWVRKADDDYRTATLLARNKEPLHDQLCFHCQQSAEKYLKSLLEESGLSVEKTHELEKLLNQLLPHHRSLRALRRGLVFLTNFAVNVRYPGDHATSRQAKAALRWAGKVREACHAQLHIRARPKRKK
ncbi:MAG: HEPN domain-containing protein [Pirellulales bacterium]